MKENRYKFPVNINVTATTEAEAEAMLVKMLASVKLDWGRYVTMDVNPMSEPIIKVPVAK